MENNLKKDHWIPYGKSFDWFCSEGLNIPGTKIRLKNSHYNYFNTGKEFFLGDISIDGGMVAPGSYDEGVHWLDIIESYQPPINTDRKITTLVGLQFGDEGKGSISQFLSSDYDVYVRFNGGGNAGHTIYIDGKKIVTHFLPVGIINKNGFCVLGNGMVINIDKLIKEIEEIAAALGEPFEDVAKRIIVSDKAHIITSEHVQKDIEREATQNIGTTKTGIGPAYESKVNRTGIQAIDFHEQLSNYGLWMTPVETWLNEVRTKTSRNIFFEGAQGIQLDLDFGTYPFVTSSNCLPSSIGTGAGFSPRFVTKNIGVIKPYTTRVGSGPFITAMSKEWDEKFRNMAGEWGATTGRPRKCGWLDLFTLKYILKFADIDEVAICKMDIISGMEHIPVCIGYKNKHGEELSMYTNSKHINELEPIYIEIKPSELVEWLRKEGVPITIVSNGPNIEDKIIV